jgi:hypothetical protein
LTNAYAARAVRAIRTSDGNDAHNFPPQSTFPKLTATLATERKRFRLISQCWQADGIIAANKIPDFRLAARE